MTNNDAELEWGQPAIDAAKCTACGLCAEVCPTETIKMKDGKPAVTRDDKFGCLACGHCACVCPAQAVSVSGRGMEAGDAFRLAPAAARADAAGLDALLKARRSVRRYEDRPLDKEVTDRLLEMAATAPMGFPPSEVGVVVVNGKEKVRGLASDLMPAFKKWLFLGTPAGRLLMRAMMDKPMRDMMSTYVLPVTKEILEAHAAGRDLLFYGAPCVLLFHYRLKDTVDPAIACSFAAVAAEALGLGSCMIGTIPPAMKDNKELCAKWGVPPGRHVSMALILGYPAVKFTNGVRRRFASVSYL